MDAITNVPLRQRAGAGLRAGLAGAREPAGRAGRNGGRAARADHDHRRRPAHAGGGPLRRGRSPHDHATCSAPARTPPRRTRKAAVEAANAGRPGVAGAAASTSGRPCCCAAADLLAGPWRDRLNAATMLGQSKTCYQAEIDSACELADFWRFNVHFARQILAEQPNSGAGVWNRMDYRPLEGFVYAITPFNFTAIAGNLPTAPALMGNTVIWKPSPTQSLAACYTMRLLEEAGLPPGVINMVTGDGRESPRSLLADPGPRRHPLHRVDADVPAPVAQVGEQHRRLRELPAASSARPAARTSSSPTPARTSTCCAPRWSAARSSTRGRSARRRPAPSCRASVWERMRDDLVDEVDALPMGDVTDFGNFMGAVIDERSFDKLSRRSRWRTRTRRSRDRRRHCGRLGGLVRAAHRASSAPTRTHEMFRTEYFGPMLGRARLRRRRLRRRC